MNCMTTIMRRLFVAVLGLVLATPASHAQTAAPSATKAHVEFLASDKLEGREAGSPGERLAAEYLTHIAMPDAGSSEHKATAHDLLSRFDTEGGARDLLDILGHVLMGRGTEARRLVIEKAEQMALDVHEAEAEQDRRDLLLDAEGRVYQLY